jgi:hypothetical protein
MRFRVALAAQLREGVPHPVERHEHHADAMLVSQRKELIHAPEKTLLVLLPQKVVQKYTHTVEAEVFGPTEFPIYRFGVP